MSYTIAQPENRIADALEGWHWIGLSGKTPIVVTAFADVFFQANDGIYFLDTVEGKLNKIAVSQEELESLLKSEESKDHYFLSGFIDRAISENLLLNEEECYDFKVHPIIGGKFEFENIEKRSNT